MLKNPKYKRLHMGDFEILGRRATGKISIFDIRNPAHISSFKKELDSLIQSPSISQALHAWLVDLRSNTFHPYFWRDVSAGHPSAVPLTHPISDADLRALKTLSEKIPGFTFSYDENSFYNGRYQLSVGLSLSEKSKSDLQNKPRNPMADGLPLNVVRTSEIVSNVNKGMAPEKAFEKWDNPRGETDGPAISMPGKKDTRPVLRVDDLGLIRAMEEEQRKLEAQLQKENAEFERQKASRNASNPTPIAIASTTYVAPEYMRNLGAEDKVIMSLVLDFFIPVSTGKNLIDKIGRGKPIAGALAIFALDAIASFIKFKALYKLGKAGEAVKMLKDARFTSAFNSAINKEFARDAAKDFAARRFALRKFLTAPEKWVVAGRPELSARNLAQIAANQAQNYGTMAASSRAIAFTSAAGTVTSRWQKTKNVLHAGMVVGMGAFTADNLGRSIELVVSDKLPQWAYSLDPAIKSRPTEGEKRELAMQALKADFAIFWGVFLGAGASAQFVVKHAPKLAETFLWAVRSEKQGEKAQKIMSAMAEAFAQRGLSQAAARNLSKTMYSYVQTSAPQISAATLANINGAAMGLAGTAIVLADPEMMGEMMPESARNSPLYRSMVEGSLNVRRIWREELHDGIIYQNAKEGLIDPIHIFTPLDSQGKPVSNAIAEKEKNVDAMLEKVRFESDLTSQTYHLAISELFSINTQVEDEAIRKAYNSQINFIMENLGISAEQFVSLYSNVFMPAADSLGVTPATGIIGDKNIDYMKMQELLATHFDASAAESLLSEYRNRPFLLYYNAYRLANRWLAQEIQSEVPSYTSKNMQNDLARLPISGKLQEEWKNTVLSLPRGEEQQAQALVVIFKYMIMGYIQHDILNKAQSAGWAGSPARR